MKPYTLDTIRTFRTRNFTVRVTAEEETDLDLSFDETGEVREKLASGEYQAFCVKAAVEIDGHEVATDYLGGCIYETPRAFMDHRGIRHVHGGRCGSYFSNMVRTVCKEARAEVARLSSVRVRQ